MHFIKIKLRPYFEKIYWIFPERIDVPFGPMEEAVDKSSYICINCGNNVESLFRKYSPTVLKLTNCVRFLPQKQHWDYIALHFQEKCHRVADKYVEYDVIIIIIDLILLQQRAYRHILFNSNYKVSFIFYSSLQINFALFQNLWKLSVIILLIDTYIDWSSYNKYFGFKKIQYDTDYNNFDFYKIGIKNSISKFWTLIKQVY